MKAATKRAVDRSEKFWGFKPRGISKTRIVWPKALVGIGDAAQINYVSDKFDGEVREYFHKFGPGVEVFAADQPQPDGRELLVIIGKFKIKPEGIVG